MMITDENKANNISSLVYYGYNVGIDTYFNQGIQYPRGILGYSAFREEEQTDVRVIL
jgi:hypothetical protein